MCRAARCACAAVLALVALCTTAGAQDDRALIGTALVIGQSDYKHLESLANPRNDARKIEALLSDLGFETDVAANRNTRQLRRALDGFIDDAEGSDVALIYYSGHGIEAGGENYLLPTDTDLSSLDDAASNLVPLSDVVQRLTSAAKVVILLVDACRTNPFPPGTSVKTPAAPDGVAVSDSGLGTPRGAMALADGPDAGSLGVVIGFAAEPGRVALDGEAETSSPYAAALLKHLAAGGVTFGDVMTLVTEEVYLKTRTQQRPWTNASLRRFLYFGARAEDTSGDEARLRGARRTLLLTIAATPNDTRRFVETLAGRDRLPLDAVYGMLKKFQRETSAGTAELEDLLRNVVMQLRRSQRQGNLVFPDDTEFARLTDLADRAMEEGAIELALEYRNAASERAIELSREDDVTQVRLKERRLQYAAAFVRHAMDATFAFEHKTASRMYGLAYRQVQPWDEALAYQYKRSEAERLRDHGNHKGDSAALAKAIGIYQQALAHVRREENPADWSKIWNEVGETYSILGERGADLATLEKAIEAFNLALEARTREALPQRWAGTHDHLGTTYQIIGRRETGKTNLERAAASYETALDELTREKQPMHWAGVVNNLGTVRAVLGEREKQTDNLERAVALFETALTERRRDRVPLEWAQSMDNLGSALRLLGARRGDRRLLTRAVAAHRGALEELQRGRVPVAWAEVTSNLGRALAALAGLDRNAALWSEAATAYEAALKVQTIERDRFSRAGTLEAYADVLFQIGVSGGSKSVIADGRVALEEARDIFRSVGDRKYDDYFTWHGRAYDAASARLD